MSHGFRYLFSGIASNHLVSRPYISTELQAQVFADAGHLCGYVGDTQAILA